MRCYQSMAAGLLAAGIPFAVANACSSCGCTLSSDWASQGYAASSGLRIDMRFDYFDQDELRAGTHSVSHDSIPIPSDREVQQSTLNRNYTLTMDYSPNANWGLNLQIPYFNRFHSTIAEGDTDIST